MQQVDGDSFPLKHFHRAENVRLIRGGKAFFEFLEELLNQAESEIHMQFYILEDDTTGRPVLEALKRAAQRGVNVYLVLDRFGSMNISSLVVQELVSAGVRFKWFRPIISLNNMEFGRRMHHKIVAIDENLAIVTGVNLANRYNDVSGIPAWLDFAIVVEGRTALEIKRRCLQIWERRYSILKKWRKFRLPPITGSISSSNPLVKVSANDWLRGKRDIYLAYRRALKFVSKEMLIVGGYFLPGGGLRRQLKEARQRGVEISVILARVSDVRFAKPAEEYLYGWMMRQGIRIFEWKPTMMHGKVAVADNHWSTVGSFNLNYLSTFESIELNLEILSEEFSTKLADLLKEIIHSECEEVTEDRLKNSPLFTRFNRWLSFQVVRLSMRMLNMFSHKPKPT